MLIEQVAIVYKKKILHFDQYDTIILLSGNSSVGRAQPCQGWGREFESRFPLQWLSGRVAMQRFAKPFHVGSNPASASIRLPGWRNW